MDQSAHVSHSPVVYAQQTVLNAGGSVEQSMSSLSDTSVTPSSTLGSNTTTNGENPNNEDDGSGYPISAEPYLGYKNDANFYEKQDNSTLSYGYINYAKNVKKSHYLIF